MAVNGKAWAHGSTSHPARVLRNMVATLLGQPWGTHANATNATTWAGSYGVPGDGDLLVTTTGGLGYSVAAGRIAGPGTFAAAQGAYTGYNDAAVTGSFAARHATLTRIDLVCWRVRDTDEDATTFEDDSITVVAGTAGSGVPSIPSSLGTLVVLSEVTVPSSAAGTPLTFTDRRRKLSAVGAQVIATSSTRPTGIAIRDGLPLYETDTGLRYHYNSTGTAWQRDTPKLIVDSSDVTSATGTFTVVNKSSTATTDTNGDASISYGVTFLTAPYVLPWNGDAATGNLAFAAQSTSTTSFGFHVWDADSGSNFASSLVRVNWLAIGFT